MLIGKDKSICIVTTMSSSIDNWIKPFLPEYIKIGVNVTIVSNMTDEYVADIRKYPDLKAFPIDFPRGNSLFKSIKCIYKLTKFLKVNRFDMIQFSTPNASFYSSIASYMTKIPVRLYCQWGMIYVSQNGIKRHLYKQIEKLICRLSTFVQPDSIANLNYCRQEKLYTESKSSVIWNGSAKGVDLTLYDLTKKAMYKNELKERYGFSENTVVIGFVGRLGAEKGCNELFRAIQKLENKYPNIILLFVGPIEKKKSIEPSLLKYFEESTNIIGTGRVSDVEKHYAVMDVFVLPSYREGFGMSVVEAEAMAIPVIVTEYPGPISGMIPNETGLVIPVKNVSELVKAIEILINDENKRKEFGARGRAYVEKSFDRHLYTQKYIDNRKTLLNID